METSLKMYINSYRNTLNSLRNIVLSLLSFCLTIFPAYFSASPLNYKQYACMMVQQFLYSMFRFLANSQVDRQLMGLRYQGQIPQWRVLFQGFRFYLRGFYVTVDFWVISWVFEDQCDGRLGNWVRGFCQIVLFIRDDGFIAFDFSERQRDSESISLIEVNLDYINDMNLRSTYGFGCFSSVYR